MKASERHWLRVMDSYHTKPGKDRSKANRKPPKRKRKKTSDDTGWKGVLCMYMPDGSIKPIAVSRMRYHR